MRVYRKRCNEFREKGGCTRSGRIRRRDFEQRCGERIGRGRGGDLGRDPVAGGRVIGGLEVVFFMEAGGEWSSGL